MHSIPMTASMAFVVDHVFLTRLALRSALCDGAFIHIRLGWAACFTYVLDNTVIVSLLCSRPPQFHAFVLSTLFQARHGAP